MAAAACRPCKPVGPWESHGTTPPGRAHCRACSRPAASLPPPPPTPPPPPALARSSSSSMAQPGGLQEVKESKDYNFPVEEEAVLKFWEVRAARCAANACAWRRLASRICRAAGGSPPPLTHRSAGPRRRLTRSRSSCGAPRASPSSPSTMARPLPPACHTTATCWRARSRWAGEEAAAALALLRGRTAWQEQRRRHVSRWASNTHSACPPLLPRLPQDIVTRYASGTGHHVTRRFGWDCHGLPVEYEIDKKLGA